VTSHLDLARLRSTLAARVPSEAFIAPPLRDAAVALILAPHQDDQAILFIQRAEYPDDPWSGQIALPGGRRDGTDQDLLATAVRETAEETAVALTRESLIGQLDDLRPVSPHLPPIVVRPFVFLLPHQPATRISGEVADAVWVPCGLLLPGTRDETVHAGSRSLVMPGYRVGPHFIWGMTERIVTHFLHLSVGTRDTR
jgi:8-oxo-dGTP pyrophosphatase MutT (NUDIX family)